MALAAMTAGGCVRNMGYGDTASDTTAQVGTASDPIARVDTTESLSSRLDTVGGTHQWVEESGKMLEVPSCGDGEHVLAYEGFTVSYNHNTLVPDWVAYELLDSELNGAYDTKSSNFSRDPNLEGCQASREDYSHSGWDRGHMAPKADMRWSSAAYWQSHYFTNICPQNHKLNAGDWNSLERKVRNLAKEYGRVWVICGPIFTTGEFGTIGQAKVHVPDKFFKALLIKDGGDYSAIAYVMPNKGGHHSLKTYACSVDELEKMIGRDLFCQLDDAIEQEVESAVDWSYWE